MKKIGLLLDNFGPSDIAFCAITSGNKLDKDIDLCGFYIDLHPNCVYAKFGLMEAGETMSFRGPIIATSIRTAKYLSTNTSPEDKYYYVWDLEWIRNGGDFKSYRDLLLKTKVIARNEYIASLLREVWNIEPVAVIDHFDLEEIVNVST